MPVTVNLNEDERQGFTITPVKSNGQPASIQAGSLAVETQSGPAQGVVVDDGHIRIRAMGQPGASSILLTADADLGDGTQTISEIFEVNANALLAANLGVAPEGAPEADPEL